VRGVLEIIRDVVCVEELGEFGDLLLHRRTLFAHVVHVIRHFVENVVGGCAVG
jgi:hypothetical protein